MLKPDVGDNNYLENYLWKRQLDIELSRINPRGLLLIVVLFIWNMCTPCPGTFFINASIWVDFILVLHCKLDLFSSLKKLIYCTFWFQATWITRCPLLLLDTRMPYGALDTGCGEQIDLAGTGSFYNDGEADIVTQHVLNLVHCGMYIFF